MALIACPECGKQHSDTAASCPNCGYVAPVQAALLVVERKFEVVGAGRRLFIYVDGVEEGALYPTKGLEVHLEPGTHSLEVRGQGNSSSGNFRVGPGETVHALVSFGFMSRVVVKVSQ